MTTVGDAEVGSGGGVPAFAPPYLSFETLRNFIARLGEKPIPPRVDRSMMVGIAGGTQTYLLQALKAFELIGDANEVSPRLAAMATNEGRCMEEMRNLLEKYYQPQLELARQQATAAQLSESFEPYGYTGSTLRKAITFFLHMARFAEIPLSPHFRAPVQRVSGSRPRRTAQSKTRPAVVASADPSPTTAAETVTIQLVSGGTVTLSCSAAFLSLSREDRSFIFGIVDRLQEYDEARRSTGQGAVAKTGD